MKFKGVEKYLTYTVYHLHDDTSNCNGYADSCTNFRDYIKLAKKNNMTSIAFSNHYGIYDWVKKKQECDKAGIKYIHGIEMGICKSLQDNDRGSHIGLYAKNFSGVLELNLLISKSTSKGINEDKSDRHMYFNPRISLEELMNTSDNIIITTACLASPLNKWRLSDNKEDKVALEILVKWLVEHKDRCFIEIQYHNCESQKDFNRWIHQLNQKTGIPLIAGTDTHSSTKYKAECRKILQISKDSFYGEEDEFDLTWKTYEELIECYKQQDSLSEDVYISAIENTNIFANMIDGFELDKSFKYPTLYGNNVKDQWKRLIYSDFADKLNNNVIDKNRVLLYKQKISEEFKVMCELGMESFMLFMAELLTWCTQNGIPYGTGRGSVCGSVIAFVTNITDVDPIVWNTVFSRFCNEDRVSLGDIDVDFAPEDRARVYEYIIRRFTPEKTAYIAAFSTLKDRGCIDVLAKGLNYQNLAKVMDIKNQFEELYNAYSKIIQEEVNLEELLENGEVESSSIDFDNHNTYINHINNVSARSKVITLKEKYGLLIKDNSDLFYYLDGLKGTIIAKGHHPSGMIGSPITLKDNIGVYYQDGDENMPISTCAMKAIDSLNYVKFDILGLKTVGIIKDACEYAGIPYPKAYKLNWNDKDVWDNMICSKQGVFQFEGDYAHNLLKDFKPKTINHMSMVNAALRPSGKSYRDRLIAGEFNMNPSDEINTLLVDNNGFLIFQEDSIKFLTDICDFTGSAADTCRRNIGKKDKEALEKQLPQILEGYCKHSSKPREVAEEEAKQFIQIIHDSSEYQFGFNHSTAYSMNGYECTYLRTYYPLEFVAAYLNRAENKEDTNNGVDLAKYLGVTIKPIQFGKSLSKYAIDKSDNTVYKGIYSIKWCNEKMAEELMVLSKNKYISFISLLDDISQKTSLDSRQINILTGLNFFSEFGKNKYLLNCIEIYDRFHKQKKPSKQINIKDLEKLGLSEYLMDKYSQKKTECLYKEIDIEGLVNELCLRLENKSLSVIEQIKFELKYLEYTVYTNPDVSEKFYVVLDFKTYKDKTKPYLLLRNIKSGDEIKTKIKQGQLFRENSFNQFSILKIAESGFEDQFKSRMINGKWGKSDELEKVLIDWDVVK